MKKIIFWIVLGTVLTGCYGEQFAQLQKDNAQLQEQNRRMWAAISGKQPSAATAAQPPSGPVVDQRVQTTVAIGRQQHGPYVGFVGEQDRHVSRGRKVKIVNRVCDDGGRDGGLNCPETALNTWMTFSIDEQVAYCDSGFIHPRMQISLLGPNQSCWVEIGATREVQLKIRFFRNNGGGEGWHDFDATPYKTIYLTLKVGNGPVTKTIDETY